METIANPTRTGKQPIKRRGERKKELRADKAERKERKGMGRIWEKYSTTGYVRPLADIAALVAVLCIVI